MFSFGIRDIRINKILTTNSQRFVTIEIHRNFPLDINILSEECYLESGINLIS